MNTEQLKELVARLSSDDCANDDIDEAVESLSAIIAEREACEPVSYEYQDKEGNWKPFQAGELTVSRGLEILDIWWAGNWNDDMLPPVRQDLIEEDSMPVEIIDRERARAEKAEKERDDLMTCLALINPSLNFSEWENGDGENIGTAINGYITSGKGEGR